MANEEFKWFKDPNSKDSGSQLINNKSGYHKTDGTSLVSQKDSGGKRYQPGFTPNGIYLSATAGAPNGWAGDLIDTHLENAITTKEKFDIDVEKTNFGPFSKRDTLLRFNDTSSDYFQHDLYIGGKSPRLYNNNTTDGIRGINDIRLASFDNSDYENQDPVIYGFEIIIDAVSSPLLNGSIYDFLKLYPNVAEIQARSSVYYDFKNQFIKLFKTKGTVDVSTQPNLPPQVSNKNNSVYMSVPLSKSNQLNDIANSISQSILTKLGKKSYLSHYLQKIDGLHDLVESNSPESNKYIVDYGKYAITLTFSEDVSSTMGTLAHLYKLLYWSKPLGKGIIPENLLRFNCDIIVSECRNFNRVRKNVSNGSLEQIKDNVSRYIYSLKECQFYFDKMPHENIIDMGNIKAYGDGIGAYDVKFDYKYVTSKFEKWVPSSPEGNGNLFGQYVGYNNGALWKIGNKGSRTSNTSVSTPTFYTVQTNTLNENGVMDPIILRNYSDYDDQTSTTDSIIGVDNQADNTPPSSTSEDDSASATTSKTPTKDKPGALQNLKNNAKKVAKNAVKSVATFAAREVNQQISTRVQLLNNTLAKIRNAIGLGGKGISGNKNVYPKPYSPISFGIYFDVRNQLFNFIGEDIASALAGFNNVINPYNNPMKPSANPLSAILQKYSTAPGVLATNTNYVKNTLDDIVKKYGKG